MFQSYFLIRWAKYVYIILLQMTDSSLRTKSIERHVLFVQNSCINTLSVFNTVPFCV